MSSKTVSVTVVIATTAEAVRKEQIKRALNSIETQVGIEATICVVANGQRYGDDVLELFKNHPLVDYHYLSKGDFPEALRYGRHQVSTGASFK